ncbi:MAG: sugar ABC transporter permease [Atribacterota bacterium]
MLLKKRSFYILFLPALVVLIGVAIFPFFACINNSLRFYDLTNPAKGTPYIGGTNYRLLFEDGRFWHSLLVTFYFVIFGVAVQLVLGYLMASLLNGVEKGSRVLPFFLIPMVMTPVVVGLTWRLMYDHILGILNYFIRLIGMTPQPWLGTESLALFSIILTDVWEWTPLIFLILYSGMKALPTEPYEAATIDGASIWQVLYRITLPLLKPVILVAILLRAIDAFKWFDTIYIMTSGGPGVATESASIYSYMIAFNFFNIGKGSAFSIIMIILVNIFCMIFIKIIPEREVA